MESGNLDGLLTKVQQAGGGFVLSQNGQPQAVVLSIERYNQLVFEKQNSDVAIQKKKVLVTGGAGYIGGHLVHLLVQNGYQVVVVDDLSTGRLEHIPDGVEFVNADFGDIDLMKRLFTEHGIEAVIHLAALLEVEESVREPKKYFETNVTKTLKLLRAMEDVGVKEIIFSSTAAVYGEQVEVPIPESAKPEPNNPYGSTKLLAEKVLEYAANYQDFRVTVLRYFNVAGCEPAFGVVDTHKKSHLIPVVLDVVTGKSEVFILNGSDYQTFDGTCVRDFVHVMDVALAHLVVLEKSSSGFRVYNVGAGKGLSVSEVIHAVSDITERMIPIEIGPRREGDAPITVADPSKMAKELGFRTNYSTIENIIQTSWEMAGKHV